MMLMGATDLTRAFYTYIVLSNASREAARVVIDYPYQYSDTAACAAGHNEGLPLYTLNCGGGSPTLIISPAANTGVTPPLRLPGRNTVTVTAKTDFKPITVLIQWFMGSTITIQAQTTYVTWY